jgi:hypothetical protein
MQLRAVLIAAVAGATLSGCGTNPGQAVREKVQQFGTAVRHHDYRTICHDVLAPSLIERLTTYGLTCEQAFAEALGPVQEAALSVGKVTVSGDSADALALTVAADQQATIERFQLTHTSAGWRISGGRGL